MLISTDKAVNPTASWGQSKRSAEWIVQSLGASRDVHDRFVTVRFGNVLGSRGQRDPDLPEQIARAARSRSRTRR